MAALVVLIGAGVAIWWFMSDDDSSDDAAAQSAPSAAAPSAGANPSQPPVGTNPSQPPVGTNPSAPGGTNPSQPPVGTKPSAPGGGSNSDLEQQAIAECNKEIDNDYTNASVSGVKLELTTTADDGTRAWYYKGTLTGTRKETKQNVNAPFKCSVAYFVGSKSFTAAITVKDY